MPYLDAEDALVTRLADLIEGRPDVLCEGPSEAWHERVLARQLAEAAALPDPFDPFAALDGSTGFAWLGTGHGDSGDGSQRCDSSQHGDGSDSGDVDGVSVRLQERGERLLARIEERHLTARPRVADPAGEQDGTAPAV